MIFSSSVGNGLVPARYPAARPTNGITIEFEIGPKFAVLLFKVYSTDHNCRDVCKFRRDQLNAF